MCKCAERQEKLNSWRPGLGDAVAKVAEPVKRFGPLVLGLVWFAVLAMIAEEKKT